MGETDTMKLLLVDVRYYIELNGIEGKGGVDGGRAEQTERWGETDSCLVGAVHYIKME